MIVQRGPDGQRFVLVDQAAAALHVLPATLRRWRSRGMLGYLDDRGRLWVDLDDAADRERAWRRRVTGHSRARMSQ